MSRVHIILNQIYFHLLIMDVQYIYKMHKKKRRMKIKKEEMKNEIIKQNYRCTIKGFRFGICDQLFTTRMPVPRADAGGLIIHFVFF